MDGAILSGWLLKNALQNAAVAEEDSETPCTTARVIEFMEQSKDQSWCLHRSYLKPHGRYVVPAPYRDMYGPKHVLPANRHEDERKDPHPPMAGYYGHRYSKTSSRDDVREAVIPTYMGLITQIDDQIGREMKYFEESGQAGEAMIVFTSGHGDYLSDHWMGDKELFHDASARIRLIVAFFAASEDATRWQVCDDLTVSINLVPTYVDYFGGKVAVHIL